MPALWTQEIGRAGERVKKFRFRCAEHRGSRISSGFFTAGFHRLGRAGLDG